MQINNYDNLEDRDIQHEREEKPSILKQLEEGKRQSALEPDLPKNIQKQNNEREV